MGDTNGSKPGSRPGAASARPLERSAPAPSADPSGHIVHDERGNAVWDWVKDTARTAVDSTSRLLKKLEVPDLKLEDTSEDGGLPGRTGRVGRRLRRVLVVFGPFDCLHRLRQSARQDLIDMVDRHNLQPILHG